MMTQTGSPPAQQKQNELSGLLLVDKPAGWTSHDAVIVARRRLGVRRIGHAGTLDPAATGLLLLLIGQSVRHQTSFQKAPKLYSGTMAFGAETDTWDADGKTLCEKPVPPLSQADINAAAADMSGEIVQIVPPYSAVKFKGVPLHRIARSGGQLPEQMTRRVTIYGWDRLDWHSPELEFAVRCSSGTYVRALAQMLGQRFGCGAHLKTLRRLSVGEFLVENALGVQALRDGPLDAVLARIIALP